MDTPAFQGQSAKRGAADSGQYFRYMAEYVGFTAEDARIIRQTKPVIVKHMSRIIGEFYEKVLRYPPTRKHFLKRDGTVDQEYLELRMRHQANFWLRTAEGVFDDDYASYVDYVGRAHTSRGADPNIYIAERYVIGQVGFLQHAIKESINQEYAGEDFGFTAIQAWDKLMMVLLELLARAYEHEREAESFDSLIEVDGESMARLAEHAFDHELRVAHRAGPKEFFAAHASEIPDGERKLVDIEGLSIGIFHHEGRWYALRNSCLHRGGPVATGNLEGNVLTCPWHGFRYDVTDGHLLIDPNAALEMYPVRVDGGDLYLTIPDQAVITAEHAHLTPEAVGSQVEAALSEVGLPKDAAEGDAPPASTPVLAQNEFLLSDLGVGKMTLVNLEGQPVAVYNVEGVFYATQNSCTHAGGPLAEGELEGCIVTCPWHGSRFDVSDGKVVEGPADEPVQTFRVVIEGEFGRVRPS